jgi:two-component system, OmpR family, sensor histidine kinase KdpD
MTEADRPDADAILARIKREERRGRGRLRIYLGAFPGVGKTYTMLNEAQRRKTYGEDVVVGFVETHGRRATESILQGLEVIPRKRIEYRDVVIEEMDVEAVLRRHPAVCLVDELAHTNAPGSEREKRYEDVQIILDAAIDVVSTLNIQHLESLNDTVESLTGVKVRETLPDSVLDDADEVILVDLSPEGGRARMEHGHIYPPEQARRALENFFSIENLAALRELALRRTADEVEDQLEELMRARKGQPDVEERVLVLLDDRPQSRTLIRHAWRLAQGFHAELLAAYMRRERGTNQERELARTLELAEDLNARIVPLEGEDYAKAVTAIIELESIDHLVLGQTRGTWRSRLLRRPLHEEVIAIAPDVEIHLVPSG